MIDTINFTDLDTIDKIDALIEKLSARKQELEAQTIQKAKEAFLRTLEASGIKPISSDKIADLFSDIGPKPEQPAKEDTKRGKRKVVIRRYVKRDGTLFMHKGGPIKDNDPDLQEIITKKIYNNLRKNICISDKTIDTDVAIDPTPEQITTARAAWSEYDKLKAQTAGQGKTAAKPVRTKAPKS